VEIATELAELYRRDITRLLQEVRAFGDSPALGQTLPGATNSAANLALHLEGNLREFVGRRLGNVHYVRDRPLEFSATGVAGEALVRRIEDLREVICGVISSLTSDDLSAIFPENVLGMPLTSSEFLIHLLGHFNYHLGQIDYLRRVLMQSQAIPLAGIVRS
jgi:hypothetical protein